MKHLIFIFLLACSSAVIAQTVPSGQARTKTPEPVIGGNDEVYVYVQQSPEFPGGIDSLYRFLTNNIQYPAECSEDSVQGMVVINIIVNKDGSASDLKVLRGVKECPAMETEALRVVGMMPPWAPGRNNGKPVRVSYNLPVRFRLD